LIPYRYVFGPVPSRRLGRSLGVDPIPFKTCNWNCVYCQLGGTFPLASGRAEHAPAEEVVGEVHRALATCQPDFVTFVGSGEPTLHSRLGWMIRQVRRPQGPPVAVVTNGSLLRLPAVRQELLAADVVLPTLDAGSERLYRRLNRPHPALDLVGHLAGLEAFRAEFRGQIQVEVMLVGGLNDDEAALADLAQVLARVGADQVHLNVPVRPPGESWVWPPLPDRLQRAREILGAAVQTLCALGEEAEALLEATPEEAVLSIVQRHPMMLAEVQGILRRWSPDEVRLAVENLEGQGRLATVRRLGRSFLVVGEARFR